jgi:serine/threonine protein kinase/tetratricopeptide (TPR) repeat protein
MEDLTGRTIGGYQIVEKIGRGGMATVFRAYQPSLDRDVAIKVLPPYYAEQDPTFLQRFKREARAIAKLRHPNILMVIDFGEEGDLAYLVMEYVTAGTLKERMKRPMRLEQIYNLVGQVGDALQYAHDQGVVHRDIKPSNIMLPKPDWALLTDFGLATIVGGSFLTQSGMTVGTPAYMSPEQGSGERVDHRTDIYAMGIMLYEMVVGEVPYTAETPMAVVVKHIVDPLPIPREKNPDVPEELQRVILKSLAKNPDDRYQRAAEFTNALKGVATTHPDWSATEIRTVTAVRTPQVDQPETKRFEEDDLPAAQPEDPTLPPAEEEFIPETQAEVVPAMPPAEPVSEPMEVESEAEGVEEPVEVVAEVEAPEEPTLAQPDAELVKQPAPKKKRRWLVYVGGVVTVFVCVMLVLIGLGALRDINQQRTALDSTQIPAEGENLSAEEEIGRVADLLRSGEFERAREAVAGVLRRHPAMWEPFMGLVGAQMEAGEYERAAKLLETGLEAHPDAPPENYAGLGWIYRELDQPVNALQAFENTLRRYPSYPEAHEGLIYTAIEVNQLRKEIGFLTELQQQFPDEPLIYRSLSELHRADGNPEAAAEAINTALELAPEHPKILVSAYHAFMDVGAEDRAMEMITRAVELAPEDPTVLSQAGWAYLDFGQYEQAVEMFERVLPMDEQNGWNSLGLAKALNALDRDAPRIPDLLRTAEQMGKEQKDAFLLNVLAWTYREREDCDNALRLFELVEELSPGETDAKQGIESCQ